MLSWKPCSNLHSQLRPYVQSIALIEGSSGNLPVRNLPTGNVQVLMQISESSARCEEGESHQINGPQFSVIGQRNRYSLYTPAPDTRILCIEFYPHSASAFFREPLVNLYNLTIAAADLWPQTDLLARILDARDNDEIFALVQRELLLRLRQDRALEQRIDLLQNVLTELNAAKPSTMTNLSRKFGLHRRALERLFREYIGLSPAAYARVSRITRAAKIVATDDGFAAIDYALDQGFFDQAHFNHDFKAIVGLSPTEYRNSVANLQDLH
ncbi:MAG: helix-turn-helix domain-containing protein [Leptospiraceae bacterium]|mgnify:CR=1 FL=1|nr:helix-turn-helix domain-containing protein [Leptospiraceae bacterium]